tara:strand:- start:953 stop:1567 length:615 start_codon:yes stop_codon:yes gene_type:complete
MSASTMNNTTITNALLFKAAARISEENPEVEMSQALAMAQEMAKTPLFNKLFDSSRDSDQSNTSKKAKKQKKTGPKRAKNAYMFFLAQHRNALNKELLSAIQGFKADSENYTAEADIKSILSEIPEKVPDAKDGQDLKIPVTFTTKLAGSRWKALSEEKQAPFKQMAEKDSAEKKAEFEASQTNETDEASQTDKATDASTEETE